jgi:hypothetical protein
MAMESFSGLRGPSTLGLTEYWGTAAPSASTDVGPYKRGDVVWNTEPSAEGYVGWICTSGGATGATSTWKGFGAIAA